MPEQVFYMRGFPISFGDRFVASPEVIEDLKALTALSDDQVNAVRERLVAATGFLDPKALLGLLREVLTDETIAKSVREALRNIEPDDVEPFLNALSQEGQGEERTLDPTQMNRLREVLPNLVQSYPALVRFEKAKRLATLTGQKLESVELICDLRPIFDKSRKRLEGMMPYTRLRVVATGADGLPDAFEAELTRQQVHDLAEQVSKAAHKLDVLANAIETKWLPGGLPDLPLTRAPRKDPSDA